MGEADAGVKVQKKSKLQFAAPPYVFLWPTNWVFRRPNPGDTLK